MTASPLEKTLLDVRKAYRILHDYQRCAMDLARYISTQLCFLESYGAPAFSARPPARDKINLDAWAWDWLGMYYYDFHFSREDNLHLSLLLISDTGFYVSNDPAPKETNVSTFAPAEESRTKLGFLLYRRWPAKFGETMGQREVIRRFIENDGELPRELRDAGIVGKCCDFARCHDRESTNAVIDELVALAKRHKLPLKRIKKAA